MSTIVFIGVVACLGLLSLWLGSRASKSLKSSDDYFLMGRKLSTLPLLLTLLATQVGGGTLLGAAQEAYDKGWLVLFYPAGASIGFLFLACGFGQKLRTLNISTIAEIFEKVYGSRIMRQVASFLSIASLFLVLIGMGIAMRAFFTTVGLDQPIVFSALWLMLVCYTVMGGMQAVVSTDMVQVVFIMAVLALALISSLLTELPQGTTTSAVVQVPWTTWLLMPLLFMLIEQDMAQRCFAADNTRSVAWAAGGASILLLVCSGTAIYFGVLAKQSGLEIPEGASVLLESVKAFTTPWIYPLFLAALLMAIVSTADSLLCSISSNIAIDFLDNDSLNVSRGVTLATGMAALGLCFLFDNVVAMLMLAYQLSVCVLCVPVVMAVLLKRPSSRGAFSSMLAGTIGLCFFSEVITLVIAAAVYFVARSSSPAKTDREIACPDSRASSRMEITSGSF